MAARSRIPDRGAFQRGPLRHCVRQGPGSHPFSGWTWRKCCSASGAHKQSHQYSTPFASGCPSLSVRSCRCGRAIDIFGHRRAACARAGVLERRGFALESACCKDFQAGGRVATNTFRRDMDLAVPATDNRRLEIVVDGLPLFGVGPARN